MTKKGMEKLLGLVVHPLGHRREAMAILDAAYRWTHELKPYKLSRIPPLVMDELVALLAVWPLVHANVRWPISDTLSATDATTSVTAGVHTDCPPTLTAALYRLAEHRGERVRLDWDPTDELAAPTEICLLYTSPSPRDQRGSRMPSSA